MWRSITGKMLTLNRSQCCVYGYNLNNIIAICRNYLNYLEQGNTQPLVMRPPQGKPVYRMPKIIQVVPT